MQPKVLILGNGISRLQYCKEIRQWDSEIWCSNYAFVEHGHRATRVNGHADVIVQARLWRDLHNYSYDVIGQNHYTHLPEKLRGNSGVFLVAQALDDGYEQIVLCGFDFGGKDVWTPLMDKRSVEPGLRRKWQKLLDYFPDARKKLIFLRPRPGFDELTQKYEPVFNMAAKEVIRLKAEMMKLAKRKLGYEVIKPPHRPITLKDRDKDYYRKILGLSKRRR